MQFKAFVDSILEADTGPADPSAAATSRAASSIGGSQPNVPTSSSSNRSSIASRISQKTDQSAVGAAGRTLTMATGISPMNKWDAPADASNVYSLDPRGASSIVVDKFLKATGASKRVSQPASNESFVNLVGKILSEEDSTTVAGKEAEEDVKRKEYIAQQVQAYMDQVGFEVGGTYKYVNPAGEEKQVTVTALPGQKVSGGMMAPGVLQVNMDNRTVAIPVINANWKYSIGPSAGQAVPAEDVETVFQGNQDPTETADGVEIDSANAEWIDNMVDIIVDARQSAGGAQPVSLLEFARRRRNAITVQEIETRAMALASVEKVYKNTSWDEINPIEKQNLMRDAKKQLQKEAERGTNVNLGLLHDELKKAFRKAGLYCGTMEQFETFKKGQMSAAGDVLKTAGKVAKGLFVPTHKGSTGVFA